MNLTLRDTLYLFLQIIGGVSVFIVPGWIIGRFTGTLDWRQQDILRKMALSLVLSISIWPVVVYLIALITSFAVAEWISLILVVCSVCLCIADWLRKGSIDRVAIYQQIFAEISRHRWRCLLVLGWFILGASLLIDIHVGPYLFNSLANYDLSQKVAFADAICREGVPPHNPYFVSQPSCYYYFWILLCSLLGWLFRSSPIDCRLAVVSSCLWTGVGLIVMTMLAMRTWKSKQDDRKYLSSDILAVLLLCVGGMDIIPVSLVLASRMILSKPFLLYPFTGVGSWWNQQVTNWFSSMLWIPQHIAGLISAVIGFLLFSRAVQTDGKRRDFILSGLAFATCIGTSPYQAIVWFVVWTIVLVACLAKIQRYGNYARSLVFVAFITGVAAMPFLLELKAASHFERNVLRFGMPYFEIMDSPMHSVLGVPLIALRYLLAFGTLGLLAIAYWSRKLATKDDKFFLLLAIVSVACSTLLHATIHNDDMSWRSLLPCQFVLLLWSAKYLSTGIRESHAIRVIQLSLLALGVMTTVYDCVLTRCTIAVDCPKLPQKALSLHDVYTDPNSTLPKKATIQPNPLIADLYDILLFPALYGHHQMVVGGVHFGRESGTSLVDYTKIAVDVSRLYESNLSAVQAKQLCSKYKIDCVVLTKDDPVWNIPNAWFTEIKPIINTPTARAYITR